MYNLNNQEWKSEGIRDGFGLGVLEEAKVNQKVVALTADLTSSCKLDAFAKEFPKRFIQCGVAEQNMSGVAAGLARTGLRPATSSFAAFSPGRAYDQIRVSICYSELPVLTYGGHAGLTVGEDGATHQMLEDIAMMRALPNMIVFVPCDKWQAYNGTRQLLRINSPSYLRGSRAKVPSITNKITPLTIGKIDVLQKGTDVTLVGTGIMVAECIKAAKQLAKQNISCTVLNAHTLKPFDADTLISCAKQTKGIITAEEHQYMGGLFGVVSETVAKYYPTKVDYVAVEDTFGESGPASKLLEKYQLTAQNIVERAKSMLQ